MKKIIAITCLTLISASIVTKNENSPNANNRASQANAIRGEKAENAIITFELATDEELSGYYEAAKNKVTTPYGLYTDIIVQKNNPELDTTNIPHEHNATEYKLLGVFYKEELYEKPKGTTVSIGLHSTREDYYIFGIPSK